MQQEIFSEVIATMTGWVNNTVGAKLSFMLIFIHSTLFSISVCVCMCACAYVRMNECMNTAWP